MHASETTIQPNSFNTLEDFKTGQILLLDKPAGWTSFQVVHKVRGLIRKGLNVKKIKVGHGGTLDPLASGLLIICTGQMTKQLQNFINDNKGYTGEFYFGQVTDSYDLETTPREVKPTEFLNKDLIQEAANTFLGNIQQKPPIFSAKKVDGRRAYELARAGIEVELKSNEVQIDRFEISEYDAPIANFEIHCSKGTYIRSMANDIGEKLGCGAYLNNLRRTKSGIFNIEDAWSIEFLEERIKATPRR